MSEELETQIPSLDFDKEPEPITKDELTLLKEQAKKLNISFSPNIGLDALKAKVKAVLENETPVVEEVAAPVTLGTLVESTGKRRARLRKEANVLVRIIVSCRNPSKKEWQGEFFTVSNSVIGTIKKYVPFDTEEGWHVPVALYNMIKERQYQHFYKVKVDGKEVTRGKLVPEFNVQLLPQLTKEELQELAQRQAITRSIE